tara:strand:+ start:324 stop:1016 length:693 start_codon:yes stop_codon:yes gene_type:complete
MKINTAIILCGGFGKRLNPITLKTPKPLIELKNITMLENCINIIIDLKIKKVLINIFHLGEQISNFIKEKKFPIDIEIIKDGDKILNTGGGILNMMNCSQDENFLIFNPDTLWKKDYVNEIDKMESYYFQNNLDNILLVVNKRLSFDQKLKGDFNMIDNILKKKDGDKNFIYIGCQILNKNLFRQYKVESFPINEIWDSLLIQEKLNGLESLNKFYHLTNLETFKKLEDL